MTEQRVKPGPQATAPGEWHGLLAPPARPAVMPGLATPGAGTGQPVAWHDLLRLAREPFSRGSRTQRLYAAVALPLAIPGFAFVAVTVLAGVLLSLSAAGMLAGLPLLVGPWPGPGNSARSAGRWRTAC